MELVHLGHALLSRVGSASGAGLSRASEVTATREIADPSPETMAEFVRSVAIKHGERSEALSTLRSAPGWSHRGKHAVRVFNVDTANVQYSTPYAECWSFPALKAGDRYFKLDEVTGVTE